MEVPTPNEGETQHEYLKRAIRACFDVCKTKSAVGRTEVAKRILRDCQLAWKNK